MGDQTLKNLKAAFAGECQAYRRYVNFAAKAEEDGFSNLARLFRVVAESEAFHATNHLKAIGGIGSSAENVATAQSGEADEVSDMYPMFIDQAKRDANSDALSTFFWALEAEKVHESFFEKVLENIKAGQDAELDDLYLCQHCGYTVEGELPEKCPACGKPKEIFQKTE